MGSIAITCTTGVVCSSAPTGPSTTESSTTARNMGGAWLLSKMGPNSRESSVTVRGSRGLGTWQSGRVSSNIDSSEARRSTVGVSSIDVTVTKALAHCVTNTSSSEVFLILTCSDHCQRFPLHKAGAESKLYQQRHPPSHDAAARDVSPPPPQHSPRAAELDDLRSASEFQCRYLRRHRVAPSCSTSSCDDFTPRFDKSTSRST